MNRTRTIVLVAGVRPNCMNVAPLLQELRKHQSASITIL
jgi:UDP-N-acetylglucosamine 2-epimerase